MTARSNDRVSTSSRGALVGMVARCALIGMVARCALIGMVARGALIGYERAFDLGGLATGLAVGVPAR